MKSRWANIDAWVFDLDNTLYAAEGPVYQAIGQRMTAYVARVTGLPWSEAEALQARYLHEHGATMAGMIANHNIDAHDFLRDVHDIDFSVVVPDPDLALLIERLPGQRLVYTNGAFTYAETVLERLGIAHAFHGVFAIENADLHPKPRRESFERLIARYNLEPTRTLMVEDTQSNLVTAHAVGFATVLLHPEPSRDWGEHIHHVTDSLRGFLNGVIEHLGR